MVNRTNDDKQIAPVDPNTWTQEPTDDVQAKGVGPGVLAGNAAFIKFLKGAGFNFSADGSSASTDGTLDDPTMTSAEAEQNNPLVGKPLTDYNMAQNIMYLIYSMIGKGEKTESEARESFNAIMVNDIDFSIKYDERLAHEQRKMGNQKLWFGITESIAGGIGGVAGGYAGARNPMNPGLSQSYTAAGSSASGLFKAWESVDESQTEAKETAAQTGSKVAEAAQSTFKSLVDDAGQSVSKADEARDAVASCGAKAIGSADGRVRA